MTVPVLLSLILRLLAAAYILVGFLLFNRRAPSIEKKIRESAEQGKGTVSRMLPKALFILLLWPVQLIQEHKKTD